MTLKNIIGLAMLWILLSIIVQESRASGPAWWRVGSKGLRLTPAKRDCMWLAYGQYSLCDRIRNSTGGYVLQKRRERKKLPAKNGGADCVGEDHEYTDCTSGEYTTAMFLRTVGSKLGETGGIVSKAREFGSAGKKCVEDVYDDKGVLMMSGRRCKRGRTRRRVSGIADFVTRTKRHTEAGLSLKHRDVLFMLDESGSVGSNNFIKLVRLAKAMANSFCGPISIGKQTTRVGVLNFDETVHPEINFDKYFEKAELLTGMDKDIEYHENTSGKTCLLDALKFSKEKMFSRKHGSRVGVEGTERIVVLVTDGCANCKPGNLKKHLKDIGRQFSAQGIPIITYLVTGDPGRCFDIMKGLSDGSQCYQQFHSPTWEKFDESLQIIENSPCMDGWYIGPSC